MPRRIRPIIQNHTIKKFIAEGGMAEVWHAVNKQDGRQTAVKILHPQHKGNKTIETLFQKEAKVMAKVSGHSGIIDYYAFVQKEQAQEGRPYMIMEYAQGRVIDEYIKKTSGPIAEQKLIPLFVKILDALEYAHNRKIVHRDIKPGNIIITDSFDEDGNPEIKLIDFGIAKNTDKNQKILTALRTKIGTKMGTIWYMSPEAVRESSNIDKLTDIYALGITLFQMATGKIPFSPELSEFDIQNKIVNEDLPHAQSYYPGVSEHINNIIQKATKKNKEERYQSCAEFKHALLGAIPGEDGPEPPPIGPTHQELINTIARKTAGLSKDKKNTKEEKKFYNENQQEIDEISRSLKDQARKKIAKKKSKNQKLTKLENSFYKLNEQPILKEEEKIKKEEDENKEWWKKIRKRIAISTLIISIIASLYLFSGGGISLFIKLGDNFYKEEEFNLARQDYEKAARFPAIIGKNIHLKKMEARLKIGDCYYNNEEFALAKIEYKTVSESSTKYTGEATFNLAKIFYQEGNIPAAEAQIDKYENLPLYRKEMPKSEEYLIKGLIYSQKKKWTTAKSMFGKVSLNYINQKTSKERKEYFSAFGESSYYTENYTDAVKYFKRYMQDGGNNNWLIHRLANAQLKEEEYEEAIGNYTKTIESNGTEYISDEELKNKSYEKRADAKRLRGPATTANETDYCNDYAKLPGGATTGNKIWKQHCYTAPVSNSRTTNTNRIFFDFFSSTDEDYQRLSTTSTTGGYSGNTYYVMKQKEANGNQFSWEYLRNSAGNKYMIPSNLTRTKTTVKFKLGPYGVFYFAFKSAPDASNKSYVLTLYEDVNKIKVNYLEDSKWGPALEDRSLDISHNTWYTLTIKRTSSTYSFYLDKRFLFSTTCRKSAGYYIAWGLGGTSSTVYEKLTLDKIEIFKH